MGWRLLNPSEMMITGIHRFLTTPTDKASKSQIWFWFSLSLTLAGIYAFLALREALSGEYVVQDDARQHVFWMGRFLDPGLFPNDAIADYFQSVDPFGYTTFYRLFAFCGIPPLLLSKFLPLVLGLVTTSYCFWVCLLILPVPGAGFMAALLLNQNLWLQDDLVSATPVAFVYPLFLAFLYYLLRRELFLCLGAIALLGLFYPQSLFIATGILILQLCYRANSGWQFNHSQRDYWFCGLGLGVAFLVLLSYALTPSEFGAVITVTQAKALPAFSAKGWSSFFNDDPWNYWVCGKRSGILPHEWCRLMAKYSILLLPPQIWLSLFLPVLLRYPHRFSVGKYITHRLLILPQMLLVSVGMFFVAHLFLFKLHLPNRYTEHSLRISVALAGGIALTIILDRMLQFRQRFLALGLAGLVGIMILLYPSALIDNNYPFPTTRYIVGNFPKLYQFFQEQPKDIVIASLVDEANNLPSFAQRSILVGGEGYALPYHLGYYTKIREKTVDLIEGQYSGSLDDMKNFIHKYGVDFWLIDLNTFTPDYVNNDPWLREYHHEVIVSLDGKKVPVLLEGMDRCNIFEDRGLVVVDAECLLGF